MYPRADSYARMLPETAANDPHRTAPCPTAEPRPNGARMNPRSVAYPRHDLEDVFVLDASPALRDEITNGADNVHVAIHDELHLMLAVPDFEEALPGYFGGDDASQARVEALREWIRGLKTATEKHSSGRPPSRSQPRAVRHRGR